MGETEPPRSTDRDATRCAASLGGAGTRRSTPSAATVAAAASWRQLALPARSRAVFVQVRVRFSGSPFDQVSRLQHNVFLPDLQSDRLTYLPIEGIDRESCEGAF